MSTLVNDAYRMNQVVVARVERVFPFGVFVCLPDGTRAYVRRRELTQTGNLDPRQVVSEGQEIKAVVIALAEPGRNLELSVRRAEPDPWDTFVQSLRVRDTVTATVKTLSARGAFVQVVPGVDGYIPLRELAPWPVKQPHNLLWVGDQVEAIITHLDREAKRLQLSIRRQMEHQASVRGVLEFIYDKRDTAEEGPSDEEELEFVEERETSVAPAVVEQIGLVLVVDDHEEVREPLVKWLRRLGFVAEGATSPSRALALLKEKSYGLALIDLDLSGNDGLGLMRALHEGTSGTRVAAMSTPERIAQRGEELASLGVADAFVKPLDLDEVREALVRLGHGEMLASVWSVAPEPDEEAQSSFQQLGATMRSGLSLGARLEAGLKELVHIAQAEEGLIFHLDPDSQQVSIVAQVGELPLNRGAVYALRGSPVKDVIYERDEVFEARVSLRARRRFSNLLALLPFESCVGVPLSAEGEVHHALFLFHREPDAFSRYRLRDARAMAMLFSVALESQALEERIRSVSPVLLSGQLAAGFGHEVCNKMSGLEIQIRNLLADCACLDQRSERCQPAEPFDSAELSQAADRLLTVALDLKDTVELFQRLLQARPEEYVDVNEVVRRAVQLLRPIARQHRMRVDVDLTPNLPLIIGSAVRLQQVFANLMLNAVQHTAQKMDQWPDGRGMLQVTTAWEPEDEYPIRVRFIDNGPGIHRQLWESIFALGFSTRPGGTGLGLFIARSLVESMGGQVVVERSAIPVGTTFRVKLPKV